MKKLTKQDKRIFVRSFAFSAIIFGAIIILMLGISVSYEAIRRVGFCDNNKQSVSITPEGDITILDFTL